MSLSKGHRGFPISHRQQSEVSFNLSGVYHPKPHLHISHLKRSNSLKSLRTPSDTDLFPKVINIDIAVVDNNISKVKYILLNSKIQGLIFQNKFDAKIFHINVTISLPLIHVLSS